MNDKSRLFRQIVNQILRKISKLGTDEKKLPSVLSLSNEFDVSRTIIYKAIDDLIAKRIIQKSGRSNKILREIQSNDFYDVTNKNFSNESIIQEFFLEKVRSGEIRPGSQFSVLELSNESGCNRTVVNEFLFKFSKFGMVEKLPRKMWGLVNIDEDYISELVDTRQTLELDALNKLWELPKTDPIWQKFNKIQQTAQKIQYNINIQTEQVLDLEEHFYRSFIQVNSNRFIQKFYDTVFFVFNFQYQWCLEDEQTLIDTKLIQLISLLETIAEGDKKQSIELIKSYMSSTSEIFKEAITRRHCP
jgi:GntR family transcriptional regulator, transcriptional activator for L-galactonate catabolism